MLFNHFSYTLGVLPEKEKHLTGVYDLVAVLTHKGRSADSGHYVAWVKQENGWCLVQPSLFGYLSHLSDLFHWS